MPAGCRAQAASWSAPDAPAVDTAVPGWPSVCGPGPTAAPSAGSSRARTSPSAIRAAGSRSGERASAATAAGSAPAAAAAAATPPPREHAASSARSSAPASGVRGSAGSGRRALAGTGARAGAGASAHAGGTAWLPTWASDGCNEAADAASVSDGAPCCGAGAGAAVPALGSVSGCRLSAASAWVCAVAARNSPGADVATSAGASAPGRAAGWPGSEAPPAVGPSPGRACSRRRVHVPVAVLRRPGDGTASGRTPGAWRSGPLSSFTEAAARSSAASAWTISAMAPLSARSLRRSHTAIALIKSSLCPMNVMQNCKASVRTHQPLDPSAE